jgi:hypothetical protein
MVAAFLGDVRDGSPSTGVEHDLVLIHKRILEDSSKYVTTRDVVAQLVSSVSDVLSVAPH